jgi:hypothetical protein
MKYISLILLFLTISCKVFAQGDVSIGGTGTPAEKMDVNGAVIIRGVATGTTAGTIQWDATDGYHEGRTSAGTWPHLENENRNDNGDYTSLTCGFVNFVSIGTYSGTSTTNTHTPFATASSDFRAQFLYKASDLVSGGLCEGDFDSIGFNIVTVGSPSAVNSFTIKLKNTSTTALSGTAWETGMTTVFVGDASTASLASGIKRYKIGYGTGATTFAWDGSSNIILEVCFDNSTGSTNTTVDYSNVSSYVCAQIGTGGVGCSISAPSTSDSKRPQLYIKGNTNGAITGTSDYIIYDKGVVVGNPTLTAPYEHHGPGTLTAEAVYDANLLISDYVFDAYYDGKMNNQDAEKHPDYEHLNINAMTSFIEQYRHLPTITGREEWKKTGKNSIGKLASQLWVTIELQAIYIAELHERMRTLETIVNLSANPLESAYLNEIELIRNDDTIKIEDKELKIAMLEKRIAELHER